MAEQQPDGQYIDCWYSRSIQRTFFKFAILPNARHFAEEGLALWAAIEFFGIVSNCNKKTVSNAIRWVLKILGF